MYQRKPCLPFFSSVVKNVASPNVAIKKLVYLYLLEHAEAEPDLALLSINTIQKSLSDQNPQVRAMALRTMSGIKVPVISQIVSLAIKRGCNDMSPQVRKTAALAIPKCYRLDPSTLPQLLEYISKLLGDKQYYVVGSAVSAFLEVCPQRIDLIHKHYRSLVRKLVDMDDWGQLELLRLLPFYARKCFPRQLVRARKQKSKGFYDDEVAEDGKEPELADPDGKEVEIDPDLELFLRACKTLLTSRNAAVVVAIARCFLHIGTPEYLESAAGPLVALLRGPQDLQQVILYNIVSVCIVRPESFVKYVTHFFIRSTDSPGVWRLKLEMLTLTFPKCDQNSKGLILNELEHFTKTQEEGLIRESVRAIGRCAQSDPKTSNRCLNVLLKQASSPDGNLVAEALTVVRHLVQQDPPSHTKTMIRLAKNLDAMTNSDARATVIWLVGEFAASDGEKGIAPDVLRILARGFADESEPAKLQIVLLAAKVYLCYLNRVNETSNGTSGANSSKPIPSEGDEMTSVEQDQQVNAMQRSEHPIVALWNYIQLLARYDTSYDLRDRARLYKALLVETSSTQLANLVLLAPKPVPHTPSPTEGRKRFLLGTSSLVVGKDAGQMGLPGYEPLPEWVKPGHEPDPKLRGGDHGAVANRTDSRIIPAAEKLDMALREKGTTPSTGPSTSSYKEKTLDDWLAEGDDDEHSKGNYKSTDSEEETDEEGEEGDEAEVESDNQGESSQLVSKES